MTKIILLLSVALLGGGGFSYWKIEQLQRQLGAAEASCQVRLAGFRDDAREELEAARARARDREIEIRRAFVDDLEALRRQLDRERERRLEVESEFSDLLDSLDSEEVVEWYAVSVPESVLSLP